jgi:predicted transcriptional regulator YdeE
MSNSTITLDEFKIIGISVRTANLNAQSREDIGKLWEAFMKDNLFEKIPNKVNSNIYCVYTEYQSDSNGEYTAVIGCSVKSFQDIPAGFVGKTIPQTKYIHYKSVGELPDSVIMTWNHIWKSDIERKYISDFDVYIQNPNGTEVDTYVSIN